MSVYYVFEKNLIDSARVYVNLLSKPQICFALPSQFLLDKRTYVYLHNYVCYFQRTATDSSYVFSQPQKRGEQSRPLTAVVEITLEKRQKMPAFFYEHLHLLFL